MIYQLSALWLLLTAATVAELFDDYADGETAVLYQQRDNVDTTSYSRLEDMLLYRLIKELMRKELQEESRRFYSRKVDKSAMKRVFPERNARPHRLLMTQRNGTKIKVCYLKLCKYVEGSGGGDE